MKLSEFMNELEKVSDLARDTYDMEDPEIMILDRDSYLLQIEGLGLDISYGITIKLD